MAKEFIKNIVEGSARKNPYEFIEKREKNDKYVLYGTGNLASAVVKQCGDRGIGFEWALVDSGYALEDTFMDIPVRTFEEFTSQEINRGKYNIIIGYAAGYRKKKSLENGNFFKHVYSIARPFEHHQAFDRQFVEEHKQELGYLYQILEDDLSRDNLCAFVNARIMEDADYVAAVSKKDMDEFRNDVYEPLENETYLDIGAYQGGSIERFLKASSLDLINKVIGLEPEKVNYENLCKNLKYIGEEKKRLVQIGCYNQKTKLGFNDSEDKCCRLDDKSTTYIDVDTVDSICADEKGISTIYIGISVAVLNILQGARETILQHHPRLIINLGTMKEELFQIPIYIKEIAPVYKLYFRFQSSMPSRLFLYAIPSE